MLLSALCVLVAAAQGFNPDSPAEPGAKYRIRVQASPQEAGTVRGEGWYAYGGRATVRATAASPAWRFVKWTTDDGAEVSTEPTFTYTGITAHHTLTAHFEAQATSQVRLSSDPASGQTTFTLSGAGTYAVGTQATLVASVPADWTFAGWMLKGSNEVLSTATRYIYTVTPDDVELVAHYRFTPGTLPAEPNETKPSHRVTLKVSPREAGSVSPSTPFMVREGDRFTIGTSAGSEWKFAGWADAEGTLVASTQSATLVMGTTDLVLTATYVFSPGNPAAPGADGQARFSLYGPTAKAFRGESVLYPIYLENTSSARSLTLTLVLPEGITASADGVQLTSRTSAYTATARQEGQDFTLTLDGGTLMSGHNGAVALVPLQVGTAVTDSTYSIVMRDPVLTLADGTQPTTTSRPGTLHVTTPEEGDLQARFTVDRYMNRAQFTNTSSQACRSFVWDFGDGTTSEEHSPMHVYQSPGTYNVRLIAKGIARTDIAEQSLIINPANTWTAEGDYTLDAKATGVRNFTSLHEAVSLLSQCTPRGTIVVAVPAGERYSMDATQADSLALLTTLTQKLTQAGTALKFASAAGHTASSIMINTSPEAESLCATMAFICLPQLDNVQTMLNGVDIHPQALLSIGLEAVCAEASTQAVSLGMLSSSPSVTVKWSATITAGSKLTGFAANGTGDLPSMVIHSTATSTQRVTYVIDYLLDGVLMHTTQHAIDVRPLVAGAVIASLSPADGSEAGFGLQRISWTDLGAQAPGGYTFHWRRTDAGGEWNSRECTTSRTDLQCAPGATYEWKVTAYGACDEVVSPTFTFTVKRQADLAVTQLVVPEAVNAQNTFTIKAKVQNLGSGTTLSSTWTDALYRSESADGLSTATRVATITRRGVLEPGDAYELTFQTQAPDASVGQVYYYVRTDDSNVEPESDERNNVALSSAVSVAENYVQAGDYEALKVLYEALGGASWTRPWRTSTAAINSTAWPGVTFDNDGRVLAINLASNNLAGVLPEQGFTLPLLTSLNLSGNRVRGRLAAFVQGLPALATLDMSACALTTLDAALPATIRTLNLANQNSFQPLAYFPRQAWAMGTSVDDVRLDSIISYNHTLRDFTAHPTLGLYSRNDAYLGTLSYSNGRYMLRLNGDYRQANGAEVYARVADGTARGNRLRAALSWLAGDANADGQVDVLDARHTLNRILASPMGNFNFMAANTYDSDLIINVQDVVTTVNMFITDEADTDARGVRSAASAANVTPRGTLRIQDNLLWLDADEPVGALDITLRGVREQQVGLRLSHTRYQMFTHQAGDCLRVVILSPSGD